MRLPLLLAALLCSATSWGRAWQGIEPGTAVRADVVRKFGEPSKVVAGKDGKEVLGYLGPRAIKGTAQTHFRTDPQTQKVERIDVFPAAVIDRETIESSYGLACPGEGVDPSGQPCYLKKVTEDFKAYLLYPSLGLAVFFKSDGKTVLSLVFTAKSSR